MPWTTRPVAVFRTLTASFAAAFASAVPCVVMVTPCSSKTITVGAPRLTSFASSRASAGIVSPGRSVRRAIRPTARAAESITGRRGL